MLKEILQGRKIHHPFHPMFVHLPIGLWVTSFILDITYLVRGQASLAITSYYCILIGFLCAILAIITGIAEFISISRGSHARRIAGTHMIIATLTTLLYLFNLISRYQLGKKLAGPAAEEIPTLITTGQFILSIFSIILLSMSSYLGGLLIYNYGIGFKPQLRSSETKKEERTRKAA